MSSPIYDGVDDPFVCPSCGERSVQAHGSGRRDCRNCEWEYRPKRDGPSGAKPTKPTTLRKFK